MTNLRVAASLTLAFAAVLGVFSWWGLFTSSGGRVFDEMDGMYPFLAGCVSALIAVAAIVMFWIAAIRSPK